MKASSGQTWRTPAAQPSRGDRVVVGVSGGVDSAMAALALVERGCEVVGVTTKNFCFDDVDPALAQGSCCSLEAFETAREICAVLGVAHTTIDVSDSFTAQVIDDYVREYRLGRTPSPCVRCNEHVRFPQLLALADRMQARWVATGHYARIVEDAHGDLFVARGEDDGKDQSYFLYRLPPAQLARIAFPLGDATKDEVRARAERHRLPVARTPDSQELCFVPDGDRSRLLGEGRGPGEIVDEQGRVVGAHRGIEFYTVGQRKGLGVGGGSPYYVHRLQPEQNRVVVGERAPRRTRLHLADAIWRDPRPSEPGQIARSRYRHRGCTVAHVDRVDEGLRVTLAEPDVAPAPGQAVVLYRDDVVIGGGRLIRAEGEE